MSELDTSLVAGAQALDRRPSMPARLLGALPLFIVFVLFALMMLLTQRFEDQIYKEMNFGTLPKITEWVLMIGNYEREYYFLMCPAMFVAAYVYFAWGCVTVRRMRRCAWAMGIMAFLMIVCGAVAYMLPMFQERAPLIK